MDLDVQDGLRGIADDAFEDDTNTVEKEIRALLLNLDVGVVSELLLFMLLNMILILYTQIEYTGDNSDNDQLKM